MPSNSTFKEEGAAGDETLAQPWLDAVNACH